MKAEDSAGSFAQELRSVELTGEARDLRTSAACNITESVVDEFIATRVAFSGCDWKDSVVRSSTFRNCTFDSATFAYSSFASTTFENCKFDFTDIQSCDFIDVTFRSCTFQGVFIKTGSFARCEFIACHSNNKLFETCRFDESSFLDSVLQIQTIAENFGIVASRYSGSLRVERTEVTSETIPVEGVASWLSRADLHPIQKVSLEYFLKESLLEGSAHIDDAANLRTWLPIFQTAPSFVVVLGQWTEFLIYLFQHNRIAAHTILTFHSMTGGLVSMLERSGQHQTALSGIGGAHLSLGRIVADYLALVEDASDVFSREVTLLVEGSGKKPQFERRLAPLLAGKDASISRVKPHNSPWEVTVTFGAASSAALFIAFFLATRTQLELSRVQRRLAGAIADEPALGRKGRQVHHTLLALEVGPSLPQTKVPNFRFKAYLPGDLMAELKITVGSRQIGKLRKAIKDVL